jgi:hypothetical protein
MHFITFGDKKMELKLLMYLSVEMVS